MAVVEHNNFGFKFGVFSISNEEDRRHLKEHFRVDVPYGTNTIALRSKKNPFSVGRGDRYINTVLYLEKPPSNSEEALRVKQRFEACFQQHVANRHTWYN